MKYETKTCPVCGRKIGTRADGTLNAHLTARRIGPGTTGDLTLTAADRCEGSGS